MNNTVAIIGGGMAGLGCAIALQKANKPFILFEASERFGGRVHSYQRKGLTVDRGFQVLLPHYPTCQKLLDYNKLDLCYYPSGAQIITDHGLKWFGKPFNYPTMYKKGKKLKASMSDYIQMGLDTLGGLQSPNGTSSPTNGHLKNCYSAAFNNEFLTPFFRGVFLDPECNTGVQQFKFYLNCFFRAGAAVPKDGMQAIPNQLVSQLPERQLQLNTKVTAINENKITINGETQSFEHIVIATDGNKAHQLLNQPTPPNTWHHVHNTILTTTQPTQLGPLTLISKKSPVSHLNIPTLLSNNLAPQNTHYMNVSHFDPTAPKTIEAEVHQLTNEHHWRIAWTDTINEALPKAQFKPKISSDHISICGDFTTFSSIEGALNSGYKTGQKLAKSAT